MKSEGILESCCRICLQENATLPIFNEDDNSISKKISTFLHEKIEDVEGYPKCICVSCNNIVESICFFVDKYKETCRILQTGLDLVKTEILKGTDEECSEAEILLEKVKIEYDFDNVDVIEDYENSQDAIVSSIKTPKELAKKITRKRTSETKLNRKFKKFKTNNVASSVLEGVFSWTGEEWCMNHNITTIKERAIEPPPVKRVRLKIKPIKKKKAKVEKLCDICGEVMKNQDKLTKHKKKAHFRKSVKCPYDKCTRVSTSEFYLNRHIKRKHLNQRDFVCTVCGGSFAFKNELTKHSQVHDRVKYPKKLFPCQFCDKTYKCQKSVHIHERSVHTGDRPAVCTVCDSSFFHEDYLKEHMRLHTGETPFKCPVCGRGYAQRGNMKSHLRIHRISELDAITLRKIRPNYLKLLKV